jgi:protein gp37
VSDKTGIEWTDATWNPVTGCTKVSPGCDHCYAETFAERWRGTPGHHFENGFDVTLRPERLDQPLRWKRPRRVFVNSMSDLFHDSVPGGFIAQVFAVMAGAPQHTFQILTKRHARMRTLLSSEDFAADVFMIAENEFAGSDRRWPLPNVWAGVSVEDQKWADIRIPALVRTPAAVRFLSCEPLLGPIDLTAWMPPGFCRWQCTGCRRFYSGAVQEFCPGCGHEGYWCGSHTGNGQPNGQPIGWVIAGGESGAGARPMRPEWPRKIRDGCQAAGVPYLFKQWGSHRWVAHSVWDEATECWVDRGIEPQRVSKKLAGRVLDGRTWDEYPAAAEAVSA